MQVTTGRSAARSKLLFRLSLAAGIGIVLATMCLIWFYRWREIQDMRQHDIALHSRIALSLSEKNGLLAQSLLPNGSGSDQASYALARSLFGSPGASATLWSSAGVPYARGGAFPSPGNPPATLPEGDAFLDAHGVSSHASQRPFSLNQRAYVLEIQTDLSDERRRIEARAAEVAAWAALMEGALIFFLLWIARKGDERLIESEREQSAMESELFFLAHYDPLTHLPNRSLFWERLDSAVGRASRLGKSVSVLVFDLSDFKRLNEERGRGAGDRALIESARRLQAAARASDLVCRIGPDEFALLLEDMDPERADEASLRLAASVARHFKEPWEDNGVSLRLGVAGGGARFPQDGSKSEELLAQAQSAQSDARSQGQGFVFYGVNELSAPA